jgi:hypothetical protein
MMLPKFILEPFMKICRKTPNLFKIVQKYKVLYVTIYTVQKKKKYFVARQKVKGKSCSISMETLKIFILLKVTWLHDIAFLRHHLKRFILCDL